MGAHGNSPSFRSPAQLRSGLASPETGNHARSLSAHPHSKLLDELMEELSMHQPYDPLAPLPLVSTTHQSTVSTADAIEMDVDAVIARYAVSVDHGKSNAYRHLLPCRDCLKVPVHFTLRLLPGILANGEECAIDSPPKDL